MSFLRTHTNLAFLAIGFFVLFTIPATVLYLKSTDTHSLVQSVDNSLAANTHNIGEVHNSISALERKVETFQKKLLDYEDESDDIWARGYSKGLNKVVRKRFWFQMLRPFEHKIFSQNGEDGVQERIFDVIGTKDKYYVEIGVQEGTECNTAHMRVNLGWKGLLMDDTFENEKINLKKHRVTKENVVELLQKYNVPKEMDYMSIDIDSFDYYIREAIGNAGYKPRIVAHEVNTMIDPRIWRTMSPGSESHLGYQNFGASLAAFDEVNKRFGYLLLYCDSVGVNCWWIHEDEVTGDDAKNLLRTRLVESVFRVMNLGNFGRRHDLQSNRNLACKENGQEKFFKCFHLTPYKEEVWTTNSDYDKDYYHRTMGTSFVLNDVLKNW